MDYIFLGLFVAFCVIGAYTKDRLVSLVIGCFRYNISLENEEIGTIRLARNALFFLFLAIFTCYLSSRPFTSAPLPALLNGLGRPGVFAVYFGVFLGFYLVKCFLLRLIGWTIDSQAFTHLLGRTGLDYCILGGLAFLPLYILFSFLPSGNDHLFHLYLIGIICIGYFLYLLRTARIFISAHFSLYFWILYLCTLEIVPIGVLFHFVVQIK